MANILATIDQLLERFANKQPAEGMHISYLEKAAYLVSLYEDALLLVEGEKNPDAEAKLKAIAERIEKVVS